MDDEADLGGKRQREGCGDAPEAEAAERLGAPQQQRQRLGSGGPIFGAQRGLRRIVSLGLLLAPAATHAEKGGGNEKGEEGRRYGEEGGQEPIGGAQLDECGGDGEAGCARAIERQAEGEAAAAMEPQRDRRGDRRRAG